MPEVTLNPLDLARLIPYAHKSATRYAMHGVAVSQCGGMVATDGKIISRIGDPGDAVIVIPIAACKELGRAAKTRKRDPERAITISGPWESDAPMVATVHRASDPQCVYASIPFRSLAGVFPPHRDVYDDAPRPIVVGLDLALLERMARGAKAAGATVARFAVSANPTEAKRQGVRVTITAPGVDTAESIIMPMRLD